MARNGKRKFRSITRKKKKGFLGERPHEIATTANNDNYNSATQGKGEDSTTNVNTNEQRKSY